MSEPSLPQPKPFNVAGYLFRSTLWVFLLIGLFAGCQMKIVPLPFTKKKNEVIREDTDLSEYIPFKKDNNPFKKNNKLVRIKSPMLTIDSAHPKIHGAYALYPVYAAAVEATYRNTGDIDFNPYLIDWHVSSGTSPGAFSTLLDGSGDMVFMARPSKEQLQEAADKGVELVITPFGYEAFVFFVSKVNPVDGLTLEQIRRIYSKEITHWEQVGGKAETILPFQRPEGSGSQTVMLAFMGDVPIASPIKDESQISMGGIVSRVADYKNYGNAIGYSFRYYVEGMFKHNGVKLLKINGIVPTVENIQNKSYPMIGECVIITRRDNTNPNVPKLIEWFLSPQGQQLVKDVGYVPMK